MKLTKKEAIKRHRELWGWLAENPMKEKQDWPEWKQYGYASRYCFCCEIGQDFLNHKCDCPLDWGNNNKYCCCEASFYEEWKHATKPEERSRLAALIRDLPEKVESKPEPKFKVGDKVVPVGQSFYGPLGYSHCWKRAQQKGQQFLYVVPVIPYDSMVDYVCSEVMDDNSGDYFLESDLIPYTDPQFPAELKGEWIPKHHAPENKILIFDGPATVCLINVKGKEYKGVAKCHPNDTFDEEFGKALAETRALIKAYRDIERRLIAKASQREG
jgi:hypothetical protein